MQKITFDRLNTVGKRFRVAVIADPQVEGAGSNSLVAKTSATKLSQIVAELNTLSPRPDLVVINGDMVDSVAPKEVENFLALTKGLSPLTMVTHGNHDGYPPYAEFKAMQKALNGTEHLAFSFDCGAWHFVTIPCNFPEDGSYAQELLAFLEADLAAHHDRPTIAFIHYHLMPGGLSQLEWYTYEKAFKNRLLDILARHGNVRYTVHGHVHNGIEASVKMGWSWRGIQFLIAPTCTASRAFGEEYPPFEPGMSHARAGGDSGGGYYLLFDFEGSAVQVSGRLVGVKTAHPFPAAFKPYQDEEPLWRKNITDYPVAPSLVNGEFRQGLRGWHVPYRYQADREPAYISQADAEGLQLLVRDKDGHWGKDEMIEAYQRVAIPHDPVLTLNFTPEASPKGCAYVRVALLRGANIVGWFMAHWGEGNTAQSGYFAQNLIYNATGKRSQPWALRTLAAQRKGLFWKLSVEPGKPSVLTLPLKAAYETATGGDFAALGADSAIVAVGAWCLNEAGAKASVRGVRVAFASAQSDSSATLNAQPLPCDTRVLNTEFGRILQERQKIKKT